MKHLPSFATAVVVILFVAASSTQNDTKGLGRVQKILGKEAYVLCEPLREYTVIDRMTTALTTSVVGRSTIQKQMQQVIDRANKRVENGKMDDFDAAITDDGDKIVLVKFKD